MVHNHFGRRNSYISRLIRRKARSICRHPGFSISDVEDIAHDLWVHLLKRQNRFDPSRGIKFETFANRIIEHHVCSMLRARKAQKRDPLREEFSLYDEVPGFEDEVCLRYATIADRSAPVPHRNDLAHDVQLLIERLGDMDSAVAMGLLGGLSVRRFARQLGISRRQVNRAIERIRELAELLDIDGYMGD
jgi:RNA polymerase sigma factor (sigma-70 family)